MSSAETGQMSAVETGQMSAAETGQMSADETGQMSAVGQERCLLLTQDRCLLFRKALACPVRAVVSGSTRRGLTRGEESEEGGSVDYGRRAVQSGPSIF